jgi:Holliday junction DNA helicase RuvB
MRCHPEVIAQLQIAVTAALERGEPLDHVLIYGPGDSEKSEIAQAVAGELGVRCFRVSGNGVRRTHDLMSALAHLSNRDVLVVSELDGLPSDLASILSAAAETFCVDVRGVESAERRRLPPFTLVGLASRVSDVPAPLRRVFGIICELQQQP